MKLRELETYWWIEYARAIDHYETFGRFAWEEFGGRVVRKVDVGR